MNEIYYFYVVSSIKKRKKNPHCNHIACQEKKMTQYWNVYTWKMNSRVHTAMTLSEKSYFFQFNEKTAKFVYL